MVHPSGLVDPALDVGHRPLPIEFGGIARTVGAGGDDLTSNAPALAGERVDAHRPSRRQQVVLVREERRELWLVEAL